MVKQRWAALSGIAFVVLMLVGAALVLAIVVSNGFLTTRGRLLQGWDAWLGFINRPDILSTMILTSVVTVLFVYWHRDQERK